MKTAGLVLLVASVFRFSAAAQSATDARFELALPEHQGQLSWSAERFKAVEYSAKPEGREIGVRGKDESGRLTFLAFLFLFPEQALLTSAKCRDGVLDLMKKSDPGLKVETKDKAAPSGPSIAMARYAMPGRGGKMVNAVRGFVATGDICGDLEVYSDAPITADDAVVEKIFASYRFDKDYSPQFDSVLLYAQTFYKGHMYKAAAPIFEVALAKLKENPDMAARMLKDTTTAKRVVTDQAGMAYGMSGDITKARSLFERAIVEDPDYPLNYYNLACADAEEKNLAGARTHLQQAFARKANVIPGEAMPDPTKDDSFLPYRDNKEFWTFLQSLQPK
jgi:tetratricopeptide (TPR) repeat protein